MGRNKGWVFVFLAIALFAINFLTIWNQAIISAKWASFIGALIGLVICPLLLLIGILLLVSKKK